MLRITLVGDIQSYLPVLWLLSFAFFLLPFSANAGNGVTLSLETPEEFALGVTYILPITLTTDGVFVNAAQLEILVDPEVIRIESFSLSPALCDKEFLMHDILMPEYGIAYKSCGTPLPLYATSTIVGTLIITPLTSGTSTIEFGAHTSMHAADGLGTQILTNMENLDISVSR